uniref:Ig-like domain-containing protein n=1 Tax=Echeneis naucrates TaxID=173247 RepID=A0A665TM96_ECHNA
MVVPSRTREDWLWVKSRLELSTTASAPPEFTLPLYNRSAYIGEDVRFGVTITVHPEPQVTWLKNGEKIKPGDDDSKYTFTSDKGLYQLMIHNLDKYDDAEYTVMAHNKFGEDSCKARLTVTPHPMLEETMRPMFKRLLANIDCIEGHSVRFELRVSGIPSPTLKWEKDGKPLQFGPKVVVIQEDVDHHILYIRETLLEDAGVYKVTATNSTGSISCQATLKVDQEVKVVKSAEPSVKSPVTSPAPSVTSPVPSAKSPEPRIKSPEPSIKSLAPSVKSPEPEEVKSPRSLNWRALPHRDNRGPDHTHHHWGEGGRRWDLHPQTVQRAWIRYSDCSH